MYDTGGDVGARDTPNIRGRKKETSNRSLVASLGLEGNPMGGRRHALDLFGTDLFDAPGMCGLMYYSASPNRS